MNNQCNALTDSCYIDNASPLTSNEPTPNLLKRVLRFFYSLQQQRIDRLAFNNLLSLDDNLLRDIGVSRGDVEWASNLPMSTNAALELERLKTLGKRSH